MFIFRWPCAPPPSERHVGNVSKGETHSPWLRREYTTTIFELGVGFEVLANSGFQQWSTSYSLNTIDSQPYPSSTLIKVGNLLQVQIEKCGRNKTLVLGPETISRLIGSGLPDRPSCP